jgi:hypothetical protein
MMRCWNLDRCHYRRQHIASGRIDTRTKFEMHDEFGLKLNALNSIAAGRTQNARG